jgi:alkylmercury lyase-like protein
MPHPLDDTGVRLALYREFVTTGQAPSIERLSAVSQVPAEEVRAALERLAAGRAIVLQPESREILMAPPLSAVPTPFAVRCLGRQYFGTCAWDALGIPAMLGAGGTIAASCGCCGEAMSIELREGQASGAGVIHFAVPARQWWADIVFT